MKKIRSGFILLVIIAIIIQKLYSAQDFYLVLGRPTDKSVTLSITPLKNIDIIIEYGQQSGLYTSSTAIKSLIKDSPSFVLLENLTRDRKYYYRIKYRESGTIDFLTSPEYSFRTQREKGSAYTFTIESDPHLYDKKGCTSLMDITLANQLNDSPDFMLDLGDTYGDDHNAYTITKEEIDVLHKNYLPRFNILGHSVPLYFCLGNHEGEFGYYLLQNPPNNLAVYGTLARKKYFANPYPDGFYTGNVENEPYGIGYPENYYAWEWGDALYVVLDAYRYVTVNEKPRGWEWTLGETQYKWFKETLEKSTSKYKLVFIHHILGQTRGAIGVAKNYEWGGYENNNTTYGFDFKRAGWGLPIHQLMVKNGVNIFFQGHDHIFAKEEMDGVIYQTLPMPSDSTYIIGIRDNGDAFTGIKYDGSGHLRVSVNPDSLKVEYVSSYLPKDETVNNKNGAVRYSYSVKSKTTDNEEETDSVEKFVLNQNYPNPFNPETTISFYIPEEQYTVIKIYNIQGREAGTLVKELLPPGEHSYNWDASGLSAGVYFYRINAGKYTATKKAVYLK